MRRAALLALLVCCKRSDPPWAPSDSSLHARFDDHRTEFNHIADFFDAHHGFQGYSPNHVEGPTGECHTPGRGLSQLSSAEGFICGARTVTSWADVESAIGVPFANLRDDLRAIGFCSVSRLTCK